MTKAQGQEKRSLVASVLGIAFAVIGIFVLGIVFVPLALIASIVGLWLGFKADYTPGIVASVIAIILTAIAFATSPMLVGTVLSVFDRGEQEESEMKENGERLELQTEVTTKPGTGKRECREYTSKINIGGEMVEQVGTVCRDAGGNWKIQPK